MFSRSVSWFICTFVAVAIATPYSGRDSNTGSFYIVAVDHLRTDNLESSTADPLRKPDTAVDLVALLDAGHGAVVALVAGDTRLVAHRAVLSARSPVLQRILQDSSTGEVAIQDVEGPVLRQLLSYLYTLQAPQLPGMAPQLLAAAQQYGLPALKADCEQQVAAQLSVENAAATAVLAIRHSCDSLRKAAIAYIRDHIFHVMATRGWADAVKSQPEVMVEVMQLLSESPAETSSSAPHSDHSAHQTPTSAAPTTVAQTITSTEDVHIPFLRSLSSEEKKRRLMEAAKQGAVWQLEALLAAGADVGARDKDNRTALHWAAEKGHEEAARRLLAAGADVGARDSEQRTPLHVAAWEGHTAVVRLLLANDADHSARDENGRTPLHVAAYWGHPEAAAALLEAGADRAARDKWGDTPLDDARQRNHRQVMELLQGR